MDTEDWVDWLHQEKGIKQIYINRDKEVASAYMLTRDCT